MIYVGKSIVYGVWDYVLEFKLVIARYLHSTTMQVT